MATSGNKKPVERKFVDASGKQISKPTGSGTAKKPAAKPAASKPAAKKPTTSKPASKPSAAKPAVVTAEAKKRATGLRIGAIVLWVAAIALEVLTILLINGTWYIPGNRMVYIIIGIVLDLACVIIGSQLWKRSNRLNPISEKNKFLFFIWNQMGVIAAVLAFFPLVLLLLKEDDLDKKTKRILAIIAAVAMLLSVGTSIDYNPVSSEDLANAQSDSAEFSYDGTAYWTPFGHSYHFNPDCHTLMRSSTIYSGAIEEAFEANRTDPCDFCAKESGEYVLTQPTLSGSDAVVDKVSDSDLIDLAGELLDAAAGSGSDAN